MANTGIGSSPATTTFNIDVASCVRRYNRMIVETLKSQSSGVSLTLPFDVARMRSYVAAMKDFQSFVVSQPLLDCPETGPTEVPLQASPVTSYIENESGYDIIELLQIARDELANSQSSRLPTNFLKFDYDRQTSYLNKINALLDYVNKSEPLDLPESSPTSPVSGKGNQGV